MTKGEEDILLDEWEKWCIEHKNEPHCPCNNCNYFHPGNALKLIQEIKQMTCISLAYGRESVAKQSKIDSLEKEKKELLAKIALLEKPNDVKPA